MNLKTQGYFDRLKKAYASYNDNQSLMALADVSEMDDRARTLRIYREQPKTQELLKATLSRFRMCASKLLSSDVNKSMTDLERAYNLASMDWCKFTLDVIGEDPDLTDKMVDDMVEAYARAAGFIPN